jgi:beta-glucanase (GH16 family)
VTEINQDCYEKTGQCYSVYGFEYKPGFDDGYIQWIANNATSWFITSAALVPDATTGIGSRPIPQEPLYLLVNLGQSTGFTPDISPLLKYPVTMYVDYIRVYQPKGQTNVGCDPKDFPTAKYINECVRPAWLGCVRVADGCRLQPH